MKEISGFGLNLYAYDKYRNNSPRVVFLKTSPTPQPPKKSSWGGKMAGQRYPADSQIFGLKSLWAKGSPSGLL